MAKKYLLYIHNDRFATEPFKSQLVNELLEAHYKEISKTQFSGVEIYPAKTEVAKTATEVAEQVKQIFPEAKTVYFCKNGHAIPEGRSRCMGKGCKYS